MSHSLELQVKMAHVNKSDADLARQFLNDHYQSKYAQNEKNTYKQFEDEARKNMFLQSGLVHVHILNVLR